MRPAERSGTRRVYVIPLTGWQTEVNYAGEVAPFARGRFPIALSHASRPLLPVHHVKRTPSCPCRGWPVVLTTCPKSGLPMSVTGFAK
jgi:hypothetical protein